MQFNPVEAFKTLFGLSEKGGYNGGTLGTLDSEAFRTWFFGLGLGGDEALNLTFPIVARDGFEKNVITYKCVMSISEAIANLDYCLFNKKTNKQITSHPILDLWNCPNPMQSGPLFRQHAVADLLLDGNMFIEKVRPQIAKGSQVPPPSKGSPKPARLWALQPNWVQVVVEESRIPASYVYTAGGIEGGDSKTFQVDPMTAASDCLHIKAYAPMRELMNGRGLSPVQSAWRQVLTHNEGAFWNFQMLKQQATPSGVLQADGNLTPDQINRLKESLARRYGGAYGAGKPLVLDGGLKWQAMSLTPVEMAFIEGKNSVARDIALALKTPPILLHIPGDTTYNNVTEAKLAWYEETIIPMAKMFVEEMNRWLVSDFDPNVELRINLETISALTERREAKWTMVQEVDFLTYNEKRQICGFNAVTDGDVIVLPSKSATLQQVVEGSQLQAMPMGGSGPMTPGGAVGNGGEEDADDESDDDEDNEDTDDDSQQV